MLMDSPKGKKGDMNRSKSPMTVAKKGSKPLLKSNSAAKLNRSAVK
jgi:hypothetical protein